jgi:hypothetical protein
MALTRQGVGGDRRSGCGFEGDFVAEGFELSDVVAAFGRGVDVAVVEVGTEVVEAGVGWASRCQMITSSDRPTATMAFFLPRRGDEAPVAGAEEGIGPSGADHGLA